MADTNKANPPVKPGKTPKSAAEKHANQVAKRARRAAKLAAKEAAEKAAKEAEAKANTVAGVNQDPNADNDAGFAQATLNTGTSSGPAVVYDSTNDPPVTTTTNEAEEEQHVDEDLVKHGSFKEMDEALKREAEEAEKVSKPEKDAGEVSDEGNKETAEETPTEDPVSDTSAQDAPAEFVKPERLPGESKTKYKQRCYNARKAFLIAANEVVATEEPAQTETPEETPATTEEPAPQPVEEVKPEETPAPEEVKPEEVKPEEKPAPVEAKKPTLKLVETDPNEYVGRAQAAMKFYGDAYTPARSTLLTEALHWLNKAVAFEQAGENSKAKMAFNQALKREDEAFALHMAKAA